MQQPSKFRVAIPDVARCERLVETLERLQVEVERYRLAGSAMLGGSQLGDSPTLDLIAGICRGSYQALVLPSPLAVERLWSAALEHRAEEALRDALNGMRLLVIGERTRIAAEHNGARVDYVLSRDLGETPETLFACLGLDEPSDAPRLSEPASGRVKHIVVVGHGMVAHRFAERLMEHSTAEGGPEVAKLTVIGEEPRAAYDRVRLTA